MRAAYPIAIVLSLIAIAGCAHGGKEHANMTKQLIIVCDMEGASGIFERNKKELWHGSPEWRAQGRKRLTSDVAAVCQAANECGIDDILIYDGHYAGDEEPNLIMENLPANARLFDTYHRCFDWRRIRGQAQQQPYGLVTVGQHARSGEPDAYFPHTIQTPPIAEVRLNGIHIAEIGQGVVSFSGVKYVANIGCNASMKEARELVPSVVAIPVKDKAKGWEPSPEETFPLIKEGVAQALRDIDKRQAFDIDGPCTFSMKVTDGYKFQLPDSLSWQGTMRADEATWEAPSAEMGLEIFNYVRACIVNVDTSNEK